ncbi:probable LRR receptor-like serine/threonine-protein kinase At4g31250 [Andrographis paniculata]|uniref:probable LRR receptor-like serine/threonine-protein kinase At4g31250 n=1 Tax=Andrographis paniculata TaxID=175694 RepID=UPI0021E837A1|nr:probable LRR receptor-like serine/threonine-protein kinase At4g31250 [Andrographis paniculata]
MSPVFLLFLLLSPLSAAAPDADYAASLIKFKSSLLNASALDDWRLPVDRLCSWNTPKWTGCLCANDSFVGLRLENLGLGGTLDLGAIADVPILSLSVMNNNFTGTFPGGLNKLAKLRSLFLANNSFDGEIPENGFDGMKGMRKVVLAANKFSGRIPLSLLGLPRLVELQLQDNRFSGRIPDFWQSDLTVNFSNNKLEGAIPSTLADVNTTSFLGNGNLCGKPLSPCKESRSRHKTAFIVAATLGIALAFFVILILLVRRRHSKPLKYEKSIDSFEVDEKAAAGANKKMEHGKLHFVRNDRERFDLEELLRASAEVLGSGSFGSSYKAALFSGQEYVVKRFKHMSSVRKGEFYEHMRRLGRLSHRNLLPLVAFYYRREEKLLITDFVGNGSLASHLHGKKSPNQPVLDWPMRLKIIKGVARGLAYLYKELPTLTLPHGHLKSSNVLLDANYEPILADYALVPVINKDHAHQYMAAYKSPESTQATRLTRKTDVWSLGILILELLTGRFPANYLKKGRGPSSDLDTWVKSVVREEWTGEVFDKDMNIPRHFEGQMLQLLKIGMCCCEWNVDRRCDLREAVERIEELKERESDGDYSSYMSDGDAYSSVTMTEEGFSVSKAL